MSEDVPPSTQRSWLERLGHAFTGETEPRSREDLIRLLREAKERHILDADALSMIEGVLQVSEKRVRDAMIPRSQMVVIPQNASLEDILPIIVESAHSRFPVIGESRDEVVGILLAKDLLAYCLEDRRKAFQVRDVLRPAVFIPESKRLNVLLKEFRTSRNHMAIVVDEYGGVAGLITIEDVLEQIVGEIADEYDVEEEKDIIPINGRYRVKALTSIEEFNEYFGTQFSDTEFDTIGGLVLKAFGHFPRPGETIVLDHLQFRVLRGDKRRIHLLEVVPLNDRQGND
ncbi:MAG: CBS domain-containing protein [Gammaproteobacteria bacterium]|nr:MAG: CBS domain-containing protein [Gammaproteobacteria bacterium]